MLFSTLNGVQEVKELEIYSVGMSLYGVYIITVSLKGYHEGVTVVQVLKS